MTCLDEETGHCSAKGGGCGSAAFFLATAAEVGEAAVAAMERGEDFSVEVVYSEDLVEAGFSGTRSSVSRETLAEVCSASDLVDLGYY